MVFRSPTEKLTSDVGKRDIFMFLITFVTSPTHSALLSGTFEFSSSAAPPQSEPSSEWKFSLFQFFEFLLRVFF